MWYKRYWLTQHEYIHKTKEEIRKIHERNRSDLPFYLIFEWIYENITEPDILRTTVDFIQDHYPKMPNNIYGKIFLYYEMYQHFEKSRDLIPPEERIPVLSVFL